MEPQGVDGGDVEVDRHAAVQQDASLSLRLRAAYGGVPARGEGHPFELNCEIEAAPGFTILFGASGAGKTTLLNCIAGITQPSEGRISAAGNLWFDSSSRRNTPVHLRRVGYVLQDLALFPHLNVQQNVAYGLRDLAGAEKQARCAAILTAFRIEPLRDRRPNQISGGEKQRVALARALVIQPLVLLLDEPLAALDRTTKASIVDDLRTWNREHGVPILYATHSREEVFALGDRVLVMEDGKIIADGTPHEVMRAPRTETVAQLVGFENVFDVVVVASHPDRGTMTCRLQNSAVELETPLVRAEVGSSLWVGIRAGDILLATAKPSGLSARNILPGSVVSLDRRDVIVAARVQCGVEMEVQLTLAARDALELSPGRPVWLIVKTHSCHLMSRGSQKS